MLLEKQKHEGYQLNYTVAAHSQGGVNWTINRICQCADEELDVEKGFTDLWRDAGVVQERGGGYAAEAGTPGVGSMKEKVISLVVGLFVAALIWQYGWPFIYSKVTAPWWPRPLQRW